LNDELTRQRKAVVGQIKVYYHNLEELRRNIRNVGLCISGCIISTPNCMKIRSNLLDFYMANLIFHKTTNRWHHELSAGRRDGFTDRQDEPISQGWPTRPASGDAL
jgi:hypothetical protein